MLCLDLLVHLDHEDLTAGLDQGDLLAFLVYQDRKDQGVILVFLATLDLVDPQDLLDKHSFLTPKHQMDLLAQIRTRHPLQAALLGTWDREALLDHREDVDLRVHLDKMVLLEYQETEELLGQLEHQAHLGPEVKMEREDPLVPLVTRDLVDHLETKEALV